MNPSHWQPLLATVAVARPPCSRRGSTCGWFGLTNRTIFRGLPLTGGLYPIMCSSLPTNPKKAIGPLLSVGQVSSVIRGSFRSFAGLHCGHLHNTGGSITIDELWAEEIGRRLRYYIGSRCGPSAAAADEQRQRRQLRRRCRCPCRPQEVNTQVCEGRRPSHATAMWGATIQRGTQAVDCRPERTSGSRRYFLRMSVSIIASRSF